MFPEALIMSGNVATFDEFIKLSDAGASFIRVGIGGGSACTTRIETGHGVPTLQSIIDIDKMRHDNDAAIIADGGLRSSGDAAKAFAAGAKFVMLGGMLARTNSAPEIRDSNNILVFRGMASSVFTDRVEGVSHALDRNGVSSVDVLAGFGNGLRSACSYSGVHELFSLSGESEYVVVSSSSVKESGAHFNA
jgi:IMP dehydrogenase